MKKYIFAILVSLMVVGSAFAQKNPLKIEWVYEDSADAVVWNIAPSLDSDTSIYFDVSNLPETGLSFQFYWNCGDSGTVVAILQQNSLINDLGAFASMDDSAAAITYISSWAYADSTILNKPVASGTTAARGSMVWNPTLVGPARKARLILQRRAGTVARTISVAAIKEY